MDVLTIFLTSVISCLASAVVASLVAIAKSSGKRAQNDASALKEGVRALLWRELNTIYQAALADGGISAADLKHEGAVYAAYHGLGGNGSGTHIHELINDMDVLV